MFGSILNDLLEKQFQNIYWHLGKIFTLFCDLSLDLLDTK